jgi:hypothetical protein
MKQSSQLKKAIIDLYSTVLKLRLSFPDRKFTPDGRMVGDIGEAIAALEFGVILDKKQKKDWDGYRKDSSEKKHDVQIKTTQKNQVYLKKPPCEGILIVLRIYHSLENILWIFNFC